MPWNYYSVVVVCSVRWDDDSNEEKIYPVFRDVETIVKICAQPDVLKSKIYTSEVPSPVRATNFLLEIFRTM